MLLLSMIILIVFGSLNANNININRNIARLAILSLVYSLVISISIGYSVIESCSIYNGLYQHSSISLAMGNLILIIAILLLFISSTPATGYTLIDNIHSDNKEYGLLILFNTIGLLLFPMVNDTIALFITLELQSYSLYLITSLYNKSNTATKAGLLYFLIGGLASTIILAGSGLIYYSTGLTALDLLYIILPYSNGGILGLVFILIGLTVKMGLAPVHNWSVTVYNYSPMHITAYISLLAKLSILPFLYNVFTNIDSSISSTLISILVWIVFISMIVGSLSGLQQIKIKTLLAYSGVLNAGYLLYTVAIQSPEALTGFFVYIYQYSLTHVNLFLIILTAGYYVISLASPAKKTNTNNSASVPLLSAYSPIEYIGQLQGLIYHNGYLGTALAISLFSLIGIPPLIGFYGKYLILISGLNTGYITLAFALIICSVIATVYYAYIIRTIVFKAPVSTSGSTHIQEQGQGHIEANSLSNSLTYIISAITLIILCNMVIVDNLIQGAYTLAISCIPLWL